MEDHEKSVQGKKRGPTSLGDAIIILSDKKYDF
jgi:hypothetical protein